MRVQLVPVSEGDCNAVEVRITVPMKDWGPAAAKAGNCGPGMNASQVMDALLFLAPGHRTGRSSLTSMAEGLRKAEDLAHEVKSWEALDAVPIGRMVRAIIAAGVVLEDVRG